LGAPAYRFKDLYLSGGISIGDAKTVGHRDISLKYDLVYMTAGVISPADDDGSDNDNSVDLGKSAARFNDIYATNSSIQTSDRNEKQDIEELSDAEQRVAVACKSLLRKFRWKSAVEDKGDEARIHFGIIAQDLQDAFEAEGLDAGRYAMFISTTWTNEDGEEQTRMGVRYSELLAFIISAI
jgi:ribosomal protein L9